MSSRGPLPCHATFGFLGIYSRVLGWHGSVRQCNTDVESEIRSNWQEACCNVGLGALVQYSTRAVTVIGYVTLLTVPPNRSFSLERHTSTHLLHMAGNALDDNSTFNFHCAKDPKIISLRALCTAALGCTAMKTLPKSTEDYNELGENADLPISSVHSGMLWALGCSGDGFTVASCRWRFDISTLPPPAQFPSCEKRDCCAAWCEGGTAACAEQA